MQKRTESPEAAAAYERVFETIDAVRRLAQPAMPRAKSFEEFFRTLRDDDAFLNENPGP